MAIQNPNIADCGFLNYGQTSYPIRTGGLLVGLPAEVETALLALKGYSRVEDVEDEPQAEVDEPCVETSTPVEAPTTATASPAEIRATLQAAVEAARPKNYQEAQTIAREKLLEMTGGVIPTWLSASERAGLGFPLIVEAVPKAAPVTTPKKGGRTKKVTENAEPK